MYRLVVVEDLSGQIIADRYRIARLIGEGGMGSVFEAHHQGTSRRVALKIITVGGNSRDEMLARFAVEARAAGRLESDHVAQVFDYGRDDERGIPFLAMEFLQGESLRQLLSHYRPLPVDLALRIATQACRGLAAAHARGVLHRDLKPANFFLNERDRGRIHVKLLDFGVARIADEEHHDRVQDIKITTTSTVIGSPLYMSPEQTNGLLKVDERSEVFSLGVVIFELLAGTAPHSGATGMGDLIIRVCREHVPLRERAPDIPEPVAAVVDRALALAPAERWPSVAALLEQLERLMPDDSIEASMLAHNSVPDVPPGAPADTTSPVGSRDPGDPIEDFEDSGAFELREALDESFSSKTGSADPMRTTSGLALSGQSAARTSRRMMIAAALVIVSASGVGWWLGTRAPSPDQAASASSRTSPQAASASVLAVSSATPAPALSASASSSAAATTATASAASSVAKAPAPVAAAPRPVPVPAAPAPKPAPTATLPPPPPPPTSTHGFEEEM